MMIDITIDKPINFPTKELESFLNLLIEQNQIINPSIDKIKGCYLLCFVKYDNLLIGIGAIKQGYKTQFDKAGVSELKSFYNHELGYLYVIDHPEIRGKGLGKEISRQLISSLGRESLFATTEESESNPMKFILEKLDFQKVGNSYVGGKTGKTIALYILETVKTIELIFDDLLTQIIKGNLTHEEIEKGIRYEEFQQVSEWKLKYGYKFNVYSNDHLINGKKHFHFDNKSENVFTKFDFKGNLLETKGKPIPSNIMKELIYFLKKESTQINLHKLWDEQNPTLTHGE